MFASRVPLDLQPNRLARAVNDARARRRRVIDLTATNPTAVGLRYPDGMLASLAAPEGLRYEPHPFGAAVAREAVARDYGRRGVAVAPSRIVLTASTSEAYSLLFKLLCEPNGDDVLVPVPSYPLFDHLTRLDGVRPVAYPLGYHGRWTLDSDVLDAAWTPATRAVLAVSPNNPTGSVIDAREFSMMAERCEARQAALVVDEVFADYPLHARSTDVSAQAAAGDALVFRLGGLSKSAGLPQVKLGWIAVDGPDPLVRSALERLELICDTYLSVSTPVQVAAPGLIAAGATVRAQILERVQANYEWLRDRATHHPAVRVLEADAGWCAVLRVPATRSEEEMVLALLQQDGVLVHPGFFFDFASEAFLVVSLLPEPSLFREGVSRVMERVDD